MAPPLDATLYVIPGSHPAMVARRMLELKGIPYKRVDLAIGACNRLGLTRRLGSPIIASFHRSVAP